MAIARWYVGTDPERFYPGVPLADIEQEDWDALPEHVRASVDASDLYRKSKPRHEAAATEAKPAEAKPADTKKES